MFEKIVLTAFFAKMASGYQSLKRPRRKLFTNKGHASEKWDRNGSFEDVEKIFDDIDSDEFPSLILDASNEKKETPKQKRQPSVSKTAPKKDVASVLPSHELNIEVPFREHGPAKTSSPIERIIAVICEPEHENTLSPKNKVSSCKGVPAHRGTHKKQHTSISVITTNGPSSEESNPVSAGSSNSMCLEKTPEKVSHPGKEMTSFLQKLKEVGQVKSTMSKKQWTPVKVPPPEPDEDFMIMDIDVPLRITIPKRNATSKKKSKTSSPKESKSSQKPAQNEEFLDTDNKSPKKKGKLLKKQTTQVENVNSDKPSKKPKQPSKETNTAEDAPETAVGSKREKLKSKQTNKSSQAKGSKTVKVVKETKKSLKKTSKQKHTNEDKDNSDYVEGNIQDPRSEMHHQEDQPAVSGDQLSPELKKHQLGQKTSTPIQDQANRDPLPSITRGTRCRKSPGDWWKVGISEEAETNFSPPQPIHTKTMKPSEGRKKKTLKRGRKSQRPLGGAPQTPLSAKTLKSLNKLKDIFKSNPKTPRATPNIKLADNAGQLPLTDSKVPSRENSFRSEQEIMQDEISDDVGQKHGPSNNTFNVLISGPSNKMDLEALEEASPLSQMAAAVLSVSDLCAPPLKPMLLQPNDKRNLTQWLRDLWPAPTNGSWDVTLEDFEWFFYQDRALGIAEDYNNGTISNGKMILGSYMKKPLWVDHSATTVFHVLTSSVKVMVDLTETCNTPGHSLVAPCGHAYSIENLTSQPAALFYTRVAASPD